MNKNNSINYIELPASKFEETQTFLENVFGWEFESYGPDYMAFSQSGVAGGFFRSDMKSRRNNGSALVVIYSDGLETTYQKVVSRGGVITDEIFSFPGGRRFHFLEPSGNELSVWSDKKC